MFRKSPRISVYIAIAMVILAVIASLIIANQGEKASNTLGSSISSITATQSWRLICLLINGVEAKLYLADTPSKQAEGYMFKNSTDFLGVGAVGMLFNISTQPGYTVAFTMRNVIFPLYLLHITPVEGVGDIAVEVIYMEPGREPYIVSARSQHDYFIELDTNFYNKYIAPRGAEGILVRVTGIC